MLAGGRTLPGHAALSRRPSKQASREASEGREGGAGARQEAMNGGRGDKGNNVRACGGRGGGAGRAPSWARTHTSRNERRGKVFSGGTTCDYKHVVPGRHMRYRAAVPENNLCLEFEKVGGTEE